MGLDKVAYNLANKAFNLINLASNKYKNIVGDITLQPTLIKLIGASNLNVDSTTRIISFTPTQSYGAGFYEIGNINNYVGRTLLFTFLAKADTACNAQGTMYKYNGATNLGQVSATSVPVNPDTWTRISQTFVVPTGLTHVWQGLLNNKVSPYSKLYIKDYMVIDITDYNISGSEIDSYGGFWSGIPNISANANYASSSGVADTVKTIFYGKKVLAIGDSLTAALKWQITVASMHTCTVTTHAKGGIGIVDMVDGSLPELGALSTIDVADKDVIIFFGGMNERAIPYGVQGDIYPTQNTIWGKLQYAINKIYNLLAIANNLTCKILIVTPHCAGKYGYIDADGYQEYPAETGQTLEKLANTIKTIAQYNNCQVVDLWHDSGIGRNTWVIYAASSTPTLGTPNNSLPYPNNADQLHLNDVGYSRIGTIISEKMNLL